MSIRTSACGGGVWTRPAGFAIRAMALSLSVMELPAAVVDFGEDLFIQGAQLVADGNSGNPTSVEVETAAVLSLPKFDSGLGTLVGVSFSLATGPEYSIDFTTWGGRWDKVDQVDFLQELGVSGLVGGQSLAPASSSVVTGGWSGPFGETPSLGSVTGASLNYTLSFVAGEQDLSGFVGPGTFDVELRHRIAVDLTKGNGFSSSHIHQAGLTFGALPTGTVSVTYDFVPNGPVVPEPEEWALIAGGALVGWAGFRRRRHRALAAAKP